VTELNALQAALAAEYAVIYGYGIVGARLAGTDRDRAEDALAAHISQRDRLIALVTGLGATPIAARPAYRLPFAVDTAASARALAAHLEQGSAGADWDLVAGTEPDAATRALGISWLAGAAQRGAYWGLLQALPGQPG
jgi:Domain of unknown function (DUF4439)